MCKAILSRFCCEVKYWWYSLVNVKVIGSFPLRASLSSMTLDDLLPLVVSLDLTPDSDGWLYPRVYSYSRLPFERKGSDIIPFLFSPPSPPPKKRERGRKAFFQRQERTCPFSRLCRNRGEKRDCLPLHLHGRLGRILLACLKPSRAKGGGANPWSREAASLGARPQVTSYLGWQGGSFRQACYTL